MKQLDEKELREIIAEELELARERICLRILERMDHRKSEDCPEQPSPKYEWSFMTLE